MLNVACLTGILQIKCVGGFICGFLTGIAVLGSVRSENEMPRCKFLLYNRPTKAKVVVIMKEVKYEL